MAQAAGELQPFASKWHYLGAELREWRLLRGYSLERLGREIHVSGALLGKVEKAQRRPSKDLVGRCDGILVTDGALRRLYDITCRELVGAEALPTLTEVSNSDAEMPLPPIAADDRPCDVVDIAAYRRRMIIARARSI